MSPARILMVLPLVAAMALAGCRTRAGGEQAVLTDEQRSELARMAAEQDRLQQENLELKRQRDAALADANHGAETAGSVGSQLSDILKGGEIKGVYETDRGGIAIGDDFSFAKGSADLNEDGKKSIGQLAAKLNAGDYANSRIIVEGHTDDTPVARAANKEKFVDNWGLSAARAAAVVRALEKAGISASRLHGAFRGEHDPLTGAKDKAANRRVELYVK